MIRRRAGTPCLQSGKGNCALWLMYFEERSSATGQISGWPLEKKSNPLLYVSTMSKVTYTVEDFSRNLSMRERKPSLHLRDVLHVELMCWRAESESEGQLPTLWQGIFFFFMGRRAQNKKICVMEEKKCIRPK